MPATEMYNGYLVTVAPPKPNTEDEEEEGVVCNHSPLTNGTPWMPPKKTLVVSLRKQSHIKPIMCAAFLFVLAVIAVVLLFNALFPQLNRNSENPSIPSPATFPPPNLNQNSSFKPTSVTSEGASTAQCGARPAFSSRRRKRIVNGDISWEGQWPWQVAVEYRGRYLCGGVVIAADWVVTAAHCVYKKPIFQRLNASHFTIHAGSTLRDQTVTANPNVQVVRVQTFYVHRRYLSERPIDNYDIALLKLSHRLDLTGGFVRPTCLPGAAGVEFGPEDECYLASWGSTKPMLSLRPELSHIAMPLLTREECYAFASTISPRHLLQVNQQKFCAGLLPTVSSKRAGACKYDSGSGLVCLKEDAVRSGQGSWYLVGLVSGGNKCGEVNFYTNVTTMMDFIQPLLDGNLPTQLFKCDKGRRSIWSNQVCDGQFDCEDLSDEQECECGETMFRCDNGLCKMDLYYHCNGVDDCGDGSDERNCTYFDCEDGVDDKLPTAMVCDNVIDCYTLKDETNCECSPTQFRCANNVCVPSFWRCDGMDDCMDASDEINCHCTGDQMDCGNTRCVPQSRMCDSIDDCGNFKDEANCTCMPDHFPCESLGICLPTLFSDTCQYFVPVSNTSDSQT